MKLSDFDYLITDDLIADKPVPKRDSSRLLFLNRENGATEDCAFGDLKKYLKDGDLLILNNSKVFPARLLGEKKTGGRFEILLDRQISSNTFLAIGKGLKVGQSLSFPGSRLIAKVTAKDDNVYTIKFNFAGSLLFDELEKTGQIPLPPYIEKRRIKNGFTGFDDRSRYQTVYAKETGSAAAPTAGLHFTKELLSEVEAMGVKRLEITLHVGLGTFLPVKTDNILEHKMHEEYFSVDPQVLAEISKAKHEGRRIIAVGTTTTRVLEHLANAFDLENSISLPSSISGTTDIFIYPGYKFKCIDGLITNFHLPKSTLLMLVSAFAGKNAVIEAYKHAVKEKYRFFSYGDAMLIL
ncbi:MAG: tRNA preQ1(34) S-adenosylmethionine ribosyltransferase-isomerase QueA [Patescibacteria group bacterium]